MLAYTYMEHGRFSLIEKPVPELKTRGRPGARHVRKYLYQ